MNDNATQEWWRDHTAMAALWHWLTERNETPDDPACFMGKPWKWTPEYEAMTAEIAAERFAAAAQAVSS